MTKHVWVGGVAATALVVGWLLLNPPPVDDAPPSITPADSPAEPSVAAVVKPFLQPKQPAPEIKPAAADLGPELGEPTSPFKVVALPAAHQDAPKDDLSYWKHIDPWKDKDFTYQDASTCTQCHIKPTRQYEQQGTLDLCLMTEYAIWKTHDKHAQAYAVLEGPRGKKMGELLGMDVTDEKAGCLSCHAMDNARKANQAKTKGATGLDKLDGVNCGGCHGPSSAWNGPHQKPETWRPKSAKEKHDLGMRDLRDPATRAELCLSCHVGNVEQGKVVTHAMFAAGHPPLPPVEIATFSRNEPQHWRDANRVPAFQKMKTDAEYRRKNHLEKAEDNYHLQDLPFNRSKFAIVGAVVALRETMALTADRANFAGEVPPAVAWPELVSGLKKDDPVPATEKMRAECGDRWPEIATAHSDCLACHHDLKYPGYRQVRGFGYFLPGKGRITAKAGRPVVRSWPLGLLTAAALHADPDGKKGYLDDLAKKLETLAKATSERPFGKHDQIRAAALDLKAWADRVLKAVNDTPFDSVAALRLLHGMNKMFDANGTAKDSTAVVPDYETARQIASFVAVLYDDWRHTTREPGWGDDGDKHKQVWAALAELSKSLSTEPNPANRKKRAEVIFGIVAKNPSDALKRDEASFASFVDDLSGPRTLETLRSFYSADEGTGNRFLNLLQSGFTNRDFTDGLLLKKNNDALQALSDDEERAVLGSVGSYDPKALIDRLRAVNTLLPVK